MPSWTQDNSSILPGCTQAMNSHGCFSSFDDARKGQLPKSGYYIDQETGDYDTPSNLYDRRKAAGKNTDSLMHQFGIY